MKMKCLVIVLAVMPLAMQAADLNVTGNITSTGYIRANGDYVYANTYVRAAGYFITPGYLQANNYVQGNNLVYSPGVVQADSRFYSPSGYIQVGGYITAGSSVQANTSVSAGTDVIAAGAGYVGNFLRVGGASNTPAAKSVQIGQYATTSSFNSLVVGQYNQDKAKDGVTPPSSTAWRDGTGGTPIDPLFVVGNGTSTTANNAFTIYKDGTITMSKPQGDIPMGQFGN